MRKSITLFFNKNPFLKKSVLQTKDIWDKYWAIIAGNIIRIPALFFHVANSKVLAKPRTLGFKGGMFNPGALLLDNDKILLLAKSQIIPWFKTFRKMNHLYMRGADIFLFLDRKTYRKEKTIIAKDNIFPLQNSFVTVDFRLFRWKNQIMVNHSAVELDKKNENYYQKSVQSCLSFIDEKLNSVNFLNFPKLDFPIQTFEKNWMYKGIDDALLLFYSVNPFRVLELEDENDFTFRTIKNKQFSGKIKDPGGFGTLVSFSANPIEYDDSYWLIIIHQINYKFTGRCYYHWALLIDKNTFLPVKITSKPIFNGMGARGRLPGIRYISSILKSENEILFFAGEGDIYVTLTKKKVSEIEKLFVDI